MATIEIQHAISRPALDLAGAFAMQIMNNRYRDQAIERDGSVFFDRWFLARKAMIPLFGHHDAPVFEIPSELENLYLHRFLRSDTEEPHDHPWPNASLVLAGSYVEDVYDIDGLTLAYSRRRRPGDIVLRDAGDIHAITQVEPGTVTLFATMPKIRDWGFHTHDGFVNWQDFDAWKRGQVGA
ncbi:hypothetical protein LZK98_08265 [Sphingomonas cannabina]|uniref:hypothetical protein n=1 Tax=Sphingomonas cannabina TaxID=2899123 RepID=UPI001F189B12|nr:hypothetical protein [Sphingomonas cannabina]UIJ46923.1 hypothetical protein LZK98_08265 [Sphingomonas cannabina]